MDPTHPSAQPPQEASYHQPQNPTTKLPTEHQSSSSSSSSSAPTTHRQANDLPSFTSTSTSGAEDATPSALARGPTDPSARDRSDEEVGPPADELDGEQMRMPGEGRVFEAQTHKGEPGSGFGGEEKSFTADLGRKIEEQRGKREEVRGERERGVDVGGAVGGGVGHLV